MNKTVILESVTISKVPSRRDIIKEIKVELTTTIDILPNVSIMDILCRSQWSQLKELALFYRLFSYYECIFVRM